MPLYPCMVQPYSEASDRRVLWSILGDKEGSFGQRLLTDEVGRPPPLCRPALRRQPNGPDAKTISLYIRETAGHPGQTL